MKTNRILDHPVLGKLADQTPITFTFDNKTFEGFQGDTIASALMANGVRKLRVQESADTPRGIYCNIGHCFECRVIVNEKTGIRACMTLIEDQMVVESGQVLPSPLDPTRVDLEDMPRTYAEYVEKGKAKKEDDSHV